MKAFLRLSSFIFILLISALSLFAATDILPTDQDLSHDGYLRFSPASTDVESLNNEPDVLGLNVTLGNWVPGDLIRFEIRIDQENSTNEYFIEYTNADVVDNGGGDLSFAWDGTDGTDPLPDGVYGITLWSISDNTDTFVLDHNPVDNPSLVDGAMLNRIHAVIDNNAPIFEPELVVTETSISRYIVDCQ